MLPAGAVVPVDEVPVLLPPLDEAPVNALPVVVLPAGFVVLPAGFAPPVVVPLPFPFAAGVAAGVAPGVVGTEVTGVGTSGMKPRDGGALYFCRSAGPRDRRDDVRFYIQSKGTRLFV